MRIVSLLPSATEILFALGSGDSVVGITHECDFPPEVRGKRVVVHSRIPVGLAPAEIDRQVREITARGESVYSVDAQALRELDPDLIVTQDLCHVCAASPEDLASALSTLPRMPQIISLNPHSLSDVWGDIRTVGAATGRAAEAEALASALGDAVAAIERTSLISARIHGRPRVVCLEWLEPPYVGGHWVPEMVHFAGGDDVIGRAGEKSFRVTWSDVFDARPDFIFVMPCGYNAEQAKQNMACMQLPPAWFTLPAFKQNHIFFMDANSYFSRPGPRLVEGVAQLARAIQAEIDTEFGRQAWASSL
jgi:iron complex transport system substrate-binding protein